MIPDLSPMLPFFIGFFVLAAVAGLLAIGAVVDLVVSSRDESGSVARTARASPQ